MDEPAAVAELAPPGLRLGIDSFVRGWTRSTEGIVEGQRVVFGAGEASQQIPKSRPGIETGSQPTKRCSHESTEPFLPRALPLH